MSRKLSSTMRQEKRPEEGEMAALPFEGNELGKNEEVPVH